MKCKDCNACKKGWFSSRPDEYVCIGVEYPFVIDDIDAECTEYEDKRDMTEKEKLFEYVNKPLTTNARNSMGCSENWYNAYYAIKETFSIDEILSMSDKEIENLVRLADEIGLALY